MFKKVISSDQRLTTLTQIVDELKKDQPDMGEVKKGMRQVGLKFQQDSVDLIDSLISELNSFDFEKESHEK